MSEYLKKVLVVELHNFHFQMCFSIYFQFQSTFLEIIVLVILMLSPSPLLFIVHNSYISFVLDKLAERAKEIP